MAHIFGLQEIGPGRDLHFIGAIGDGRGVEGVADAHTVAVRVLGDVVELVEIGKP